MFCGRWHYGSGVSLEREAGVERSEKRFWNFILWLVMGESIATCTLEQTYQCKGQDGQEVGLARQPYFYPSEIMKR